MPIEVSKGFLKSTKVSINNGSKILTLTDSVDCSFIASGTAIFLGSGNILVEAVSGTPFNGSGISQITLRETFKGISLVDDDMTAFNTIEGLRDAITRVRELVSSDITTAVSQFSDFLTTTSNSLVTTINGSELTITPYGYFQPFVTQKLANLDTSVLANTNGLAQLVIDLAALDLRVVTNKNNLTTTTSKANANKIAIDLLIDRLNIKNSEVIQILSRLDGLDVSNSSVNNRVNATNLAVTAVDNKVNETDLAVTAVGTRIDGIDMRIDGIDSNISSTNSNVTSFKNALDGRVDATNLAVTAVDSRVNASNTEIGTVVGVVDTHVADLIVIKKRLDDQVIGGVIANADNADKLGGVLAADYARLSVPNTFKDAQIFEKVISVGSGVDGGITWEDGKHIMTNNDGGGNFNFRLGNEYSGGHKATTANSTPFHQVWADDQADGYGSHKFTVGNSSGYAIGDPVVFRNMFEYNNTWVKLFHEGTQKLVTTSGGITVTGDVTATNFTGLSSNSSLLGGLASSAFGKLSTSNTWTNDNVFNRISANTITTAVGQQLILSAGESENKVSGQTNEYVYVNSESGLSINTPDAAHSNWQTGYTVDTATIKGDSISLAGNLVWHEGNDENFGKLDASQSWAENQTFVKDVDIGGYLNTDGFSSARTNSTANQNFNANFIDANFSGSDELTADRVKTGLFIDVDSSASGGDTSNEHRIYGLYTSIKATGDSDLVYGNYSNVEAEHSVGQISELRGAYNYALSDVRIGGTVVNTHGSTNFAVQASTSSGNTSNLYGSYNKALKAANNTTATATGVYAEVEVDTGILTTAHGVRSYIDTDGGSITNGYLFYGDYQGNLPTNAYGIYITDAVLNHFGGKVRTNNQFESKVTTGTAPLIVASTTRVANLNADYLDGFHHDKFGKLADAQTWAATQTLTSNLNLKSELDYTGASHFYIDNQATLSTSQTYFRNSAGGSFVNQLVLSRNDATFGVHVNLTGNHDIKMGDGSWMYFNHTGRDQLRMNHNTSTNAGIDFYNQTKGTHANIKAKDVHATGVIREQDILLSDKYLSLGDLNYDDSTTYAAAWASVEAFKKWMEASDSTATNYDTVTPSLAAGFLNATIGQFNLLVANKANVGYLSANAVSVGLNSKSISENPFFQNNQDVEATAGNSAMGWTSVSSKLTYGKAITDGQVADVCLEATSSTNTTLQSNPYPVEEGKTYKVTVWARNVGSIIRDNYLYLVFQNSSNVNINSVTLDSGHPQWKQNSNPNKYWLKDKPFTSVWTKYEATFSVRPELGDLESYTAPDGASFVKLGALLNHNGVVGTGTVQLQDYRIEEMTSSTTIVDGTITTQKLNVQEIFSKEISATGSIIAGSEDEVAGLTGSSGDWMIYAGDALPASAPFRVNKFGKLVATDAEISGKITVGSTELTESNTLNTNTTKSNIGLSNVDNTSDADIIDAASEVASDDSGRWVSSYLCSSTLTEELLERNGSSLSTYGFTGGTRRVIKVSGVIKGTGTDTGAVSNFIYTHSTGTWTVETLYRKGTSSNHIDFLISDGVPSVRTWHANNYTVTVQFEEEALTGQAAATNSAKKTAGKAGGWTIDSTSIFTGTKVADNAFTGSNSITLGNTGYISSKNFKISSAGNVEVLGKITATTGKIGKWNIDSTSMYTGTKDTSGYTSSGMTVNGNGNGSLHAVNSYIGTDGKLVAKNATISGKITVGSTELTESNTLNKDNMIVDAGFLNPFVGGLPTESKVGGNIPTSEVSFDSRANTDDWGLNHLGLTGDINQGSPYSAVSSSYYKNVQIGNFSVTEGTRYGASVYSGAHRCKTALFIYWYNAAGSVIGNTSLDYNNSVSQGGSSLNLYKRLVSYGDAPSGAVSASLILRKYDTNQGQTSSYYFYVRPQFSQWSPTQTVAPEWTLGASLEANKTTGTVAGWTIDSTDIYSGNDKVIDSNGWKDTNGIVMNSDGSIKSPTVQINTDGSAKFKGDITGASGTFSGSLNVSGYSNDATVKAASASDATAKANAAIAATQTITLINSADTEIIGNTVRSTSGASWTSGAYSKELYSGGVTASCVIETVGSFMFGLNDIGSSSSTYQNIDYAIYGTGSNFDVYESGSPKGTIEAGAPVIGDVISVSYDGEFIKYFINGVVRRTLNVPAGLKLGVDMSFATTNCKLKNIQLIPLNIRKAGTNLLPVDLTDIDPSNPPDISKGGNASSVFRWNSASVLGNPLGAGSLVLDNTKGGSGECYAYLGKNSTDYNFKIPKYRKFIISGWLLSGMQDASVQFYMRTNDSANTHRGVTFTTGKINTWQRFSKLVDFTAFDATHAIVRVDVDSYATLYIANMMVEAYTEGETTEPSRWISGVGEKRHKDSGTVAGWNINSTQIYSGSTVPTTDTEGYKGEGGIVIESGGAIRNSEMQINEDGSAAFKGELNATRGSFGANGEIVIGANGVNDGDVFTKDYSLVVTTPTDGGIHCKATANNAFALSGWSSGRLGVGGYFRAKGQSSRGVLVHGASSVVSLGAGTRAVYATVGTIEPFTGSHEGLIPKGTPLEVGDIVCDVELVNIENISNAICKMSISTSVGQKSVRGIFTSRTELISGEVAGLPKDYTSIDDEVISFNSVGEGAMNVCGEGGDLEIGDLIISSSMAGKGMKQSDDIVRSITVAEVRQNVTFTSPEEVRQVAVIYRCG
jgi:hypothetical protein